MNSKPIYKNPIDRLIRIYAYLQGEEMITTQALAEHFKLTERTIQQDLKILKEAELIQRIGNGYALTGKIEGITINLTKEQAAALLVAEKLTQEFTETTFVNHFQKAIHKVRVGLKKDDANYQKALDAIHIYKHSPTHKSTAPTSSYFSDLNKAIAERYYIRVRYNSTGRHGCVVEYEKLEPVTFAYYLNDWHVLARNPLAQNTDEQRVVCRFEEILDLEVLEKRFKLRIDTKEFIENSFATIEGYFDNQNLESYIKNYLENFAQSLPEHYPIRAKLLELTL